PDAPAVPLALGRDGVVEVARGGRVDGEGGELGQVAAREATSLGLLRRPRRFLLDQAGETAQAEPLLEQVGDGVPGAGRLLPSERLRTRPAATPRRRLPPPPAPAPLAAAPPATRRQPVTCAATVSSALCRASSTPVFGLSTA